jgi:Na+-transporting methylmalonyl-CoA/oxaloacetate decarboxylase gamma subunit
MKQRQKEITALSLSPAAGRRQRGMTLVFSLVILLILTILGLSTLRTASLEQLMSGNTQEQTRALEAADSGLSKALNVIAASSTSSDLATFVADTYTYQSSSFVTNEKTTSFAKVFVPTGPAGVDTLPAPQLVEPQRSSTPSGSYICTAYYDQWVVGTTAGTFAQVSLHQGLSADRSGPCRE